MLKKYCTLSVKSALVSIFILFLGCTSKENQLKEQTVVKVNKHTLNAASFARLLGNNLKKYDSLTVKDKKIVQRAKKTIVKEFIIDSITKDFAKSKNIMVFKKDINQEVQKIHPSYPDKNAFKEVLIKEDINYDFWMSQIQFRVLQKKVIEHLVSNNTKFPEADLKSYYKTNKDEFKIGERIKIKQIVLKTEVEADRILKELKSKRSFKELANKFSITPEADSGGVVGWIQKGSFDIFDKVFDLPIGRKSKILKSPFGFHIIVVEAKKQSGSLNFKEVKPRILSILKAQREQALYSAWIEDQIDSAKVYTNEEIIDSIQIETRGNL